MEFADFRSLAHYFLPFFFHGWSQLELEERRILRRGGGNGGSRAPSSFFGTCAFPPALSDFFSFGSEWLSETSMHCNAEPRFEPSPMVWCSPQVRWFHLDWPVPNIGLLGIRKPRPVRPGLGDTSAWCRWVVVVVVQMAQHPSCQNYVPPSDPNWMVIWEGKIDQPKCNSSLKSWWSSQLVCNILVKHKQITDIMVPCPSGWQRISPWDQSGEWFDAT